MSAADEYRLLALTLPMREIVGRLEVPEDVRATLLWLEEHGYGCVAAHVEDAMAAGVRRTGTAGLGSAYWAYSPARWRCSWLMHCLSTAGIAGLRWPPKGEDSPVWMHMAALDTFRHDNALYDLGDSPRSKNVQQVLSCWQQLLFVAGVTKPQDPYAGIDATPMWYALDHLNHFQKQGYPIFAPGAFFSGYVRATLTADTQSQGCSPATALRWR